VLAVSDWEKEEKGVAIGGRGIREGEKERKKERRRKSGQIEDSKKGWDVDGGKERMGNKIEKEGKTGKRKQERKIREKDKGNKEFMKRGS
jgi:hypothetical protein